MITDEDILNFFVKNGKIISSRVNKNNIEKYPEFKNYLINRFDISEFISYAFVIKRIIKGAEELPTCHYCGKKLFNLDAKWCNSKCQLKDPEFIKYRVENTDYEKLGESVRNTCLDKYGVPGYFCLKEIHDCAIELSHSAEANLKREQTNMQLYGSKNVFQNETVKNKIKNTKKNRYNDENFSNRLKYAETCLQKYGQLSYMSTDEFKEKSYNTKFKKYKDPKYINHEQTVETLINRYGVDNPAKLEKTKINSHTKEANEKRNETKKKNKTFNTSKPEQEAYHMLVDKFGEGNVKEQYKSDKYPFNCDFYIVPEDLYIELNYHWTHGGHLFDKSNKEDLDKVELWQSKGTKYYLNAINTWTIRDINKAEAIKQKSLNAIQFYKKEDFYNWISSYKILKDIMNFEINNTQYFIRNICAEDIENLKQCKNSEFFDSNNLLFKQSFVCIDNNSNIIGYILLKHNNIENFFEGNIPKDNNNINIKEILKKYNQFECLIYLNDNDINKSSDYIFLKLLNYAENDEYGQVGVLWMKYDDNFKWRFYNFNDMLLMSIPIDD